MERTRTHTHANTHTHTSKQCNVWLTNVIRTRLLVVQKSLEPNKRLKVCNHYICDNLCHQVAIVPIWEHKFLHLLGTCEDDEIFSVLS
jgi:hypothetical protein